VFSSLGRRFFFGYFSLIGVEEKHHPPYATRQFSDCIGLHVHYLSEMVIHEPSKCNKPNGNDNIVFDLGKPIAPRTHVSGKVNPRTPIMIKKKHIQDDNNHGNIYWLVVWNIFIFPYIGNNNPN
jgi:hypothetical protein